MADLSLTDLSLADESMETCNTCDDGMVEKPAPMREKPKQRQVGIGKKYLTVAEMRGGLSRYT